MNIKKSLVLLTIISTFSLPSNAGAGTILKALAKPFEKVGSMVNGKALPSKAKLVDQYLSLSDVKRSRLDEVNIQALSSGGSGAVLHNTESKLVELEFRAMDLVETFDDLVGNSNASSGLKALFTSQVKDLSFLLAHMHVVVSKNKVYPHVDKILDIITDLDKSLSGAYITNPSYATKSALNDFLKIRKKVYSDLVDLK
ncbi:hypothetical protein [Bacteriovorax sp. Seq25_V]|uniref:hypothetical protein n=1 Tax=Bacteriovorax sp. Seq25_V TaxID=1201288 RepID=UPI00038A2B69|nr:hypothetical protein [Bacteriovorax sp. Seq25_V]EQC48048.1 hypothetical protein M900_1084 [Bacteriovorax sp. Seq25_V]